MTLNDYLSGDYDNGVIETPKNEYIAATRIWQGPVRPDYPSAQADLLDHLQGVPQ